jgi:uncharacterized protein (TIGR02611 family)
VADVDPEERDPPQGPSEDVPAGGRAHHFFRDDDVWGDEPSEVDASAVVAEMETAEPEASRRWHDHPAWVPFKAIGRFIKRSWKRTAVTVGGSAVVITGLILIPLPGPGWLVVFAGLAILATEYVWARRLLNFAKRKVGEAKDVVLRTNRSDPEE